MKKSLHALTDNEETDKRDSVARILNAAAIAFMENGFAATSIDTVAEVLGSTKGKIYYHYKSKTDLFLAVHRDAMTQYVNAIEKIAAGGGDPVERLRAALRALAMQIMTRLAFSRVAVQGVELHMSRSTTPAQRKTLKSVIAMRDRGEQILIDIVAEGVEKGYFRPCEPRLIVKPMLGAINWMTMWYRPRSDETPETRERLAKEIIDYLVLGIAADKRSDAAKGGASCTSA